MDPEDTVIKHAQRDMARAPAMAQPQGIREPVQEPNLWQEFKESRLLGEISRAVAQGAKDLHNAIVPAFPDSVRGVDEPGTPLNPTQYMVTQELHGYEAELDRAASLGADKGPELGRGL